MSIKEKKRNLTRFKIIDIYDDIPYTGIKFTTQIIKRKICAYPKPKETKHFMSISTNKIIKIQQKFYTKLWLSLLFFFMLNINLFIKVIFYWNLIRERKKKCLNSSVVKS